MSEELKKLKQKYEEYFLGVKGVTGVGVNGSIIVYVDPENAKDLKQVLPKSIDGVKVTIKESKFRLMSIQPMDAAYEVRTTRVRPVVGGISIGHPLVSAGTLGCRVRDRRTGELLGGLSNNHVIAMQWGEYRRGEIGDSTLQPGPWDGGLEPEDRIGELSRYVSVETDKENLTDAAIFSSVVVEDKILDVGKPAYTVEPKEGMTVVKSGRTSGVTYGKILDCNATIKVNGGEGWGECVFKDQIVIEPAILFPGDSGSWIGEVDSFNSIGLGWAGSETMSVANKALNVEKLLDVEIEPPIAKVNSLTMASFFASVFSVGLNIIGSDWSAVQRNRKRIPI